MRLREYPWLRLLVLLVPLVLAGCTVELYSGLTEKEGNEMLGILLSAGIASEKRPGKEQTVSLLVDKNQVARAVEILRRNGYPKDRFESIGQVFKKEGLISSPLEERIRYIFGLSQEVAETLSQIDGVIVARVHVVVPEQQPFEEKVLPSSASVFIKYKPGSQLEEYVPKIKMIVNNSVEGLTYDKIAVALFPGEEVVPPPPQEGTRILGMEIPPGAASGLPIVVWSMVALLLLSLVGNAYLLLRLRKRAGAALEQQGE